LCSKPVFENRAFYEIMWRNILEPDRPKMTIWRMRIAYWITKATDIYSEFVVVIAFPLQQRLHERVSVLRYTILPFLFILSAKRTLYATNERQLEIATSWYS